MTQHDDEIIEDYEVESSSPPAQASGGPPGPQQGRPTPAELGAAAASRGKITHGQAKMIWIICIAVCLLGGGAVAVHYFFLSDNGGGGGAAANRPPVNRGPTKNASPRRELTEHEKNVNAYIKDVIDRRNALKSSKGWDFFWCRKLRFDAAWNDARALKTAENAAARDNAWLEAIKAYLNVKYAADIFRHANAPVNFEVPEDLSISTGKEWTKEVEQFSDEHLKVAELAQTHAAAILLSDFIDDINLFQSSAIKSDLSCWAVWDKRKGEFAVEFERFEKGRGDPPMFDAADLEFVKGPNYGPKEPMEWEKVAEELKNRKLVTDKSPSGE